ncbi:MAG: NADH-quinone oxidoreductase subunit J, partial [Chloroflexi bacterium]|nr:NADH-quinone oxidoreductase subunit J [Chloroflexota bacterium]
MDASAVAFTFLAVLILGGALGVVTTRNVAHAALFLLLSLSSISGIFI